MTLKKGGLRVWMLLGLAALAGGYFWWKNRTANGAIVSVPPGDTSGELLYADPRITGRAVRLR